MHRHTCRALTGAKCLDARAAVDVSVVVATRNRAAFSSTPSALSRRKSVMLVMKSWWSTMGRRIPPHAIRAWSRRDARIRSVAEPTVGLSRAKNTGIRVAQGRLILFTDDDVVLERVGFPHT